MNNAVEKAVHCHNNSVKRRLTRILQREPQRERKAMPPSLRVKALVLMFLVTAAHSHEGDEVLQQISAVAVRLNAWEEGAANALVSMALSKENRRDALSAIQDLIHKDVLKGHAWTCWRDDMAESLEDRDRSLSEAVASLQTCRSEIIFNAPGVFDKIICGYFISEKLLVPHGFSITLNADGSVAHSGKYWHGLSHGKWTGAIMSGSYEGIWRYGRPWSGTLAVAVKEEFEDILVKFSKGVAIKYPNPPPWKVKPLLLKLPAGDQVDIDELLRDKQSLRAPLSKPEAGPPGEKKTDKPENGERK